MPNELRFAYRLALQLGIANPEKMLSAMPSHVWLNWQLYAVYEPFGRERTDLNAGIVAATVANVNRKKGTKAYKPQDFIPCYGPKVTMTPEMLYEKVKLINSLFGGEVKKLGNH